MIVTQFKLTACIRTFSFPFFLLFYCSSSFGQQKITGIVRSADSLPLEGAVIIVKNSKQGTLSASDGSFSIAAKPGDVLIVSSVGMVKKEVLIRDEAQVNVILSFAITNVEEVVVIGYGTAKKKDLTGAVASVSAKDFNNGIYSSP
ncbi:MAG: carboxypeptidase-like regulatory domain-containing protein, partial [Chitinophagaceae bacterium]|nr:carboxypeptidase-like regulatory domain-containing protein [Chitinophagaceae bacterium]